MLHEYGVVLRVRQTRMQQAEIEVKDAKFAWLEATLAARDAFIDSLMLELQSRDLMLEESAGHAV